MVYIFSMKMEEYMELRISGIFQVKLIAKKYSAWVPVDPRLTCLCSVMSLSEETCKFTEPDC